MRVALEPAVPAGFAPYAPFGSHSELAGLPQLLTERQ